MRVSEREREREREKEGVERLLCHLIYFTACFVSYFSALKLCEHFLSFKNE